MTRTDFTDYKPGDYGKKRIRPTDWLNAYVFKWSAEKSEKEKKKTIKGFVPTICISRKIGVGALEIADILAQKLGLKVIDREILEHMARDTALAQKTIGLFDERYPGMMSELTAMIFNEKSFVLSDYYKLLAKSVIALSTQEPSIFVGRGIHLILPREHVLAIRLISSDEFRINRLARIMKTTEAEAKKRMAVIDKEQRDFFKDVYQKKDASPYEFDMVINMDYIGEPQRAADIVALAFERKFDL